MPEPQSSPSEPQTPSFLQKDNTDPAVTLAWIQAQISAIYLAAKTNHQDDKPPKLDQDTYLKIYTATFNFITSVKTTTISPCTGDLYRHLESEIGNYCRDVREYAFIISDDTEDNGPRRMLKAYMAQYNKFAHLSNLVKNLMQLLERHWIRREIDEKKKDIHLLEDLHKLIWREEILQVGVDTTSLTREGLIDVTEAVAELRERDEGTTGYDMELVQNVVKSLSFLSLTLDG